MRGKIAYTFRRPDLGIDRTTKSDDGLFSFPAISQFNYAPDNLLFVSSFSRSTFIPPENPNVWTAFALQLKKTSLLKSAHTISYGFQ
jgi:hypothetical protein